MTSPIIDGTNIDFSVFSYSAPKANTAGGKVVNLFNKHFNESITLSVPLMGSWGAQETKETVGKDTSGKPIVRGTGKYTMSLQFATGQYTNPDADKFLEQMKAFEHKIKLDAMEHSKEWFGKEINSFDVIEEKVSPMLKYPKIKGSAEYDYSRPPSLSIKLPCWNNVWQTSVFDEDGNQLYIKGKTKSEVTPLDFLISTSKAPIQVICLIQCAGLWFVNKLVYVTWNLKQVVVRKPKTSSISDDTCFLTIRPNEKEILKSLPETEIRQSDSINAYVEESDNEDDYYLPPPVVEKPLVVETPLVVEKPVETPVVVETPLVVEKHPVVDKHLVVESTEKKKVVKKVKKET